MALTILSKITRQCKICKGTGMVRLGYYASPIGIYGWSSLSLGKESCRHCRGTGRIVI